MTHRLRRLRPCGLIERIVHVALLLTQHVQLCSCCSYGFIPLLNDLRNIGGPIHLHDLESNAICFVLQRLPFETFSIHGDDGLDLSVRRLLFLFIDNFVKVVQVKANRVTVKGFPDEVNYYFESLLKSTFIPNTKVSNIHSSLGKTFHVKVYTDNGKCRLHSTFILISILSYSQIVLISAFFHFINSFVFVAKGFANILWNMLHKFFEMLLEFN